MTASAVIALLTELIANLPAAIKTGEEVIRLVNDSYKTMTEAVADREVTPDEIEALVRQIVANSASIQSV
jgi:hypothetical protein